VSNTFASRRSANRRRRTEAREQILDVARRQLKIKPFRDLSVDELMQATGLSRTAFYRYFPDREAVLVDLLEEVWGSLAEARDVEVGTGGIASAASMAGLSQLLSENRQVLKAIADAAPGDEDVEQAYRAFMHSYWIEDLTARIVEAQRQGLAAGLDPELAGEALGWMAERLVTQSLHRDPNQVLDTIIAIVAKCLLSGSDPAVRAQTTGDGGPVEADSRETSRPAEANASTESEATAADPGFEPPDARPPSSHRRAAPRSSGSGASSEQD
jgi:AcrR family transcriptional regulator